MTTTRVSILCLALLIIATAAASGAPETTEQSPEVPVDLETAVGTVIAAADSKTTDESVHDEKSDAEPGDADESDELLAGAEPSASSACKFFLFLVGAHAIAGLADDDLQEESIIDGKVWGNYCGAGYTHFSTAVPMHSCLL